VLSVPGKYWRMSEESVAILVRALWRRCRTSRRRILKRAGLVTIGVVVVLYVVATVALEKVLTSWQVLLCYLSYR
jgi:hypothetical protein